MPLALTAVKGGVGELLRLADALNSELESRNGRDERSGRGQFATPSEAAWTMASLVEPAGGTLRVDAPFDLVRLGGLPWHGSSGPLGRVAAMSGSASIRGCQWLLRNLGFDRERYNERSALVLLALLGLRPGDPWSESEARLLRTVDIMGWIRDHWEIDYKPNTRETIRRQTLHQFVQAHLVVENPDQPTRPINSPKWCYQVTSEALDVIRSHGTPGFEHDLRRYLSERPGLQAVYRQERDLLKIPVMLPRGVEVLLSAGGQNTLLKAMIEEFCSRFTPGGAVLYIGDAGDKWLAFEKQALESLGVSVDDHGKMPDLVVHMEDKN